MSDYLGLLWKEIKANSPETAAFIREAHDKFNTRLHTFRWVQEPKKVLCTYHRKVEESA